LSGDTSDGELLRLWHSTTGWSFKDGPPLRSMLRDVADSIDATLFHRIADILFDQWNPLRIGDRAKADDKYEGPTVAMALAITQGSSESAMARHLANVERQAWDLVPDYDKDREVARALLAMPQR
jgi:hypothetical protein